MKFKKLVVLDNIILFPDQAKRLESLAEEIVDYRDRPIHPRFSADGPSIEASAVPEAALVCETNPEYSADERREIVVRLGAADAVLSCWTNIPDEAIARNEHLRLIVFWTNLYKHRINVEYAESRGIAIDYVPDYGTEAVTEYVFAALLHMARNLSRQAKDAATGSWRYEYLKTGTKRVTDPASIDEWLLAGKKIGIVGLGRIGTRVAVAAKLGFGMDVSYFSRTRKREIEQLGIEYCPLDHLLGTSDIVTVHLPADAPVDFIDKHMLARLRDGAIFVNTATGRAVDEAALIEELRSRRISAVLDVFRKHPPRKELKGLANVLFTYRAGWYARESLRLKGDLLLDKMEARLVGLAPR